MKDRTWECQGPVDADLVKVTISADIADVDAVVLTENCTGRIGRVEIDTWSGDGINVQNSAPVAHDLVIDSGYVRCHAKTGSYTRTASRPWAASGSRSGTCTWIAAGKG